MLKVRSDLAMLDGIAEAHGPQSAAARPLLESNVPTGIISNPRSHRNRLARGEPLRTGRNVLAASPRNKDDLRNVLARFVEAGVELLVIDGGDGTVRDVLSVGHAFWGGEWPRIAVIPAGKTNALAHDLGIPRGWPIEAALAAAERGGTIARQPLVVTRADDERVRCGFLLGVGAFARATELAQHTHRAGAFNGMAVGLALGWGLTQTLLGRAASQWRAGDAMAIRWSGVSPLPPADRRYLIISSTLERLPLGLKPLGTPRPGIKTLIVDAPPRLVAAPMLLAGVRSRWMERLGFHHVDGEPFELDTDTGIILDGELYPGGRMTVRAGKPVQFVAP